MGSDISRKIDRDNTGKVLMSAEVCSNLQRLVTQDIKVEVNRDTRTGA